jgi:hypothetical protein
MISRHRAGKIALSAVARARVAERYEANDSGLRR